MYGYRISRLALLALAAACAGTAQAQTAGALTVDLDAAGTYDSSYAWTLDKQVMPASADRFIGETQVLGYTLVVTKGAPKGSNFQVTGSATITNPGNTAATITDIVLTYGTQTVPDTCTNGPLAAGASTTCTFSFPTGSAAPQALQLNVATSGTVAGANATANVAFATGAVQNDSVTVTDTLLPEPLTFDESGTHTYTRNATCVDGNTVKVDNDATIVETGATDSARARVACHALRMERSVASQGGTHWRWAIDKSHTLTGPVQLAAGASQDVTYTITATATAENGANVVRGAISGINTHPGSEARVVSVGAAINGIAAEVTCPSLIVPRATYDANRNIVFGKLSCPFSVTLPAGTVASTVSGRITQQLFTYAPDGTPTPTSTRDLAGTQPITGTLGSGSTDECVDLADVYLGATTDLGQFCASAGSTTVTRTFTGPITVSAASECEFSVPNLARLTTNDTGTVAQDSTTVAVERTDCTVEEPTGTLEVDVTGSGAFTRRYPWTIDKTVTPASADRFIGETQELAYTLTLTRGAAQDAGYVVTATANIVNHASAAAEISAITVTYGGNPVTHSCATGTLAAGATRTCALSFTTASGEPQALLVDVDTTGAIVGDDASTMIAFGAPTVTGETITVTDTLLPGQTLTFSESGTHEYTHDATCVDGNTVVVNNTATIVETGASDTANARVACHSTRMERSVATFGGTGWNWDITKTHATALPLHVVAGQTYNVDYTITATATADEAGARVVHGAITAINTHPSVDAVILSVAAKINSTDATVTCPTPMIAPHATYDANHNIVVGKLVCPFTVTLAAGEVPSTVTGRVEQQLFDYDSEGNATPDGTRVLQGTQPVTGVTAGAVTDECVDLSDIYLGTTHDLGEFCASTGNTSVSRTFTGAITVTADSECEFTVANLARLVTNDTGTVDEASTTLPVERTDCGVEEPAGTLEASIQGSGAFTRRYPWTIEKTVTPATSDRFIGETQELAYTLTLTKGEAEDAGYLVTGTATIVNPTAFPAQITAITVQYGGVPVTHACATGTLPAGETRTCALQFPAATDDPQALSIDVDTSGEIVGAEATTMVAFGAPTVTGGTIHVDDTLLPEDLVFSASSTHEYTHDVTCVDGNTITVNNTATIVETGASDSATARVSCHAIRMERSVTGTVSQSYSWNIEKTHAQTTPLQVTAGNTYNVAYTITATATANANGSAGAIQGAITVLNTNPVNDAVILSVAAKINATDATVTCPQPMIAPRATYDVNHNIVVGKLVCPFTVTLAAGETASTVTGRVEQQLFDYDSEGEPTAAGTKVLQGTQPVGTLTPGAVTDECVNLSDVYRGTSHSLGQFCVSEGSMSVTRTFTGPVVVTSDSECEYSVQNTARLVATDTGTTDESSTTVDVQRTDCNTIELPTAGCTLTRGYWGTHSINGPAKYDPIWAKIGETTPFFHAMANGNPVSWYGVMWVAPKGNAYYILAPQFVAATLNMMAGASATPQMLDAMDEAQALFQAFTPAQIAALKGNTPPRPRFIELADMLDKYNNGIGGLGPDHCD